MIKSNNSKILLILLVTVNLIQIIECKKIYWPPIAHKFKTMHLENALMENLEKGCPNKNNKLKPGPEPEHFFAVTFTQNFGLSNPIPMQFTHIPSGYQVNFNTSCDDCKSDEFFFDGIAYKTTNFECRSLCIFMAQEINGQCKASRKNYRVSMPFGHKYLEISESCHRQGKIDDLKRSKEGNNLPLDIDILRRYEHEYLGQYSKKVFFEKSIDEKCARKCLPVCRQPISGGDDFDSDDDFESYDKNETITEKVPNEVNLNDERVNVNEYVANFMKNLCNYNKSKSSLYESYRIMDLKCNSAVTMYTSRVNISIFIISFVIFKLL